MTTNLIELDNSIDLLLKQLNNFRYQVQSLNECEENQINLKNKKQFKTTQEISNEKNLQEKETEFDQINELYLRNKDIIENETKINDLIISRHPRPSALPHQGI